MKVKANRKNIGAYVRARRLKAGLTLRGLCSLTGVSTSMLCDMECGRRDPKLSVIEKIAVGLGESVPKFLSRFYSRKS